MPKCTWKGCINEGIHEIKAKDGEVWATLCDTHKEKMDSCVEDPRKILSAWVLANGGAQAAAKRIMR